MESKRIYKINGKRFITIVLYHFETVKKFCTIAGISRQRFYSILKIPYSTKHPEAFVRLYELLLKHSDEAQYDYEIFWRKSW